MKKIVFILMLVFTGGIVGAQDLIVTNTNDSINCKITKETKDHIYFSYLNNGELRKTLIGKTDVKQFTKSNPGASGNEMKTSGIQPGYSKFRLAMHGGWSTRLAKISNDDFEQYMKDLKKGYNLGFDASYFISETIGFGLKFSTFGSDNQLDNVTIDHDMDGVLSTGTVSDDIAITFVGPSYSVRVVSNSGNAFVSSLAIGYLGYLDHSYIINYPFDLKGGAFGVAWDLGYDIKLSEHLSIGAQCSLIRGTLTSITQESEYSSRKIDLDEDEYESLSSLNFSVGLRINL